jgi:hypothetical protein
LMIISLTAVVVLLLHWKFKNKKIPGGSILSREGENETKHRSRTDQHPLR